MSIQSLGISLIKIREPLLLLMEAKACGLDKVKLKVKRGRAAGAYQPQKETFRSILRPYKLLTNTKK